MKWWHPHPVPVLLVLVAGIGLTVFAQDAAKGAALLVAAREALGGAGRLAAVRTLHVTGTFRRVMGGDDTDGDFDVFLELPDKYLRSEKTGTPGQPSIERIEALVGGQVRNEIRGGGGGRGNRIVRGGRGDMAAIQDVQRRARQADVSRLLLMWLLFTEVPVTWIGIAESPDGRADVLEAVFADAVPTRLFVESGSHMPLMMTWQGRPGMGGGRRGGPPPRGRVQAQPVLPDSDDPDAQALSRAADLKMTFSDHREVDGVRLPHLVTRAVNGETVEQWTVGRYRVNPTFDADTFTR